MARFRPSRLFRRISARNDSHSSTLDPFPPSTTATDPSSPPDPIAIYSGSDSRQLRKSSSLPKLRKRLRSLTTDSGSVAAEVPEVVPEVRESILLLPDDESKSDISEGSCSRKSEVETITESQGLALAENKALAVSTEELKLEGVEDTTRHPILVVEQPTPDTDEGLKTVPHLTSQDSAPRSDSGDVTLAGSTQSDQSPNLIPDQGLPGQAISTTAGEEVGAGKPSRPASFTTRFPSIIDSANAKVVTTLVDAPTRREIGLPTSDSLDFPTTASLDTPSGIDSIAKMLHRKIWVRRPGASPTLVQIKEDDLVDDARDTILRKYANSLGKTFDSPDVVLHIVTRAEQGQNRTQRALGPEEEMCKTIDSYYPGGQTVDEALVIDTPQRRTPRPSPKVFANHQNYYAMDEYRPQETGTDYFPPMPALIPATIPQTTASTDSRTSHHHHSVVAANADHPRSMSVLNTGQIPPLPSPGGRSRTHHNRPKYGRHPTSSPTLLTANAGAVAVNPPNPAQPHLVHRTTARPRLDSSASEAHHPNGVNIPPAPPLPSPPAPEAPPTNQHNSQPPTPSGSQTTAHRPIGRAKKPRKPTSDSPHPSRRKKDSSSASSPHPAASSGIASQLLDASVPPINVLIVEDNIINLRILEGLMKRLKVRWQTAMNGQIAVDKWRLGGFHLVLMDIQMPVMNGLEATKEIRRLERVNGIGVFSSTPNTDDVEEGPNGEHVPGEAAAEDTASTHNNTLPGLSEGLFKSPVIIVALTASSLQSDRHEALAAGCNDFLTKPVNFVWLERKVKEWGCMQALIDFDGWRLWKGLAEEKEKSKTAGEKEKERLGVEKERERAEKMKSLGGGGGGAGSGSGMAAAKKEKRGKRGSGIYAGAPPISEEVAVGDVGNGGDVKSTATGPGPLRSGREMLGEAGFELG